MLNPDLKDVLQNHLSRYSLVMATAKRARNISENAEMNKEIITEKPVTLAIEEIIRGEYIVVEPEEIRNL